MLQKEPLSHLGRIPTFRFGRIESPLTTIARSAGCENWDELVACLRRGEIRIVQAPSLSSRSIANAILLKHACDEAGIFVMAVESSADEVDYLTLST